MTIGNNAGTLVVSVLVLLCQASDGTPPSSRPPGGAVSREAAGPAPTPTKAPETGRTAEIATPRAEPPTVSASAPPAEPSPSRESAPPTGGPAPKQSAPERESQSPPESAPPEPTPPARVATLDLGSLEQRLRETKAIGVFTKLSLKNQVDDLLEQFREFHKARDQAMLAKLRQAYDLLLLKVLSLLQDGDPVLAREVSSSREALWSFLIDPDKFKSL